MGRLSHLGSKRNSDVLLVGPGRRSCLEDIACFRSDVIRSLPGPQFGFPVVCGVETILTRRTRKSFRDSSKNKRAS
jgi:hypothetical protein